MKSKLDKPNVLFLECGTSGQGGSYKSLKEHIDIMRRSMGDVIIILVNDSVYCSEYEALGCTVIKLYHPIYSAHSRIKMLYSKCFSFSSRISARLTLYVQYLFEYMFVLQLGKIVKKYKVDSIHLNNQPMRNFSGFMLAKKKKIPVISHIRTLHTYGFSKPFIEFVQACPVKFVAISQVVKNIWANLGLNKNTFVVIYNATCVDVEKCNDSKIYDFIYVGRLVEGKGLEFLINAFSKMQPNNVCKLTLIGDGYLRNKLENRVKELGISDQVIFLGFRKNIYEEISKAKVLIMSSMREGFGRVIIEAMKLKTLVIANDIDTVRELITDKKTGFIYKDLDTFFQCIDNACKLKTQMIRDAAYEYANRNFSSTKYYNQMKLIYEL